MKRLLLLVTLLCSAPPTLFAQSFASADIGAVGAAGSSSYSNGVYTVNGSGADIWDTADAFQFDYQPLTGDGTITARVVSETPTDAWAKAGVMIRETLSPSSAHALVAVTSSNGVAFQRRNATGGQSTHTYGPLVAAPYWVRLTRSGNTFSAYSSADGTTWTFVGQDAISMAATVYVGLAATSHHAGTINVVTFDRVAIGSTSPSSAPPASGWTNQDIGSVGAPGSSTQTTNSDGSVSATVKGSGADIWDVADGFQFDFKPLTGDGTITARVVNETPTNAWAKAGVMIRETLSPSSAHALVAVTSSNGVAFQRRTATGGQSTHTYGPLVAAPYWVRLTRSGNTFSAYSSADGTTWTFIGQDTISMAAAVYVGLAVTSHQAGSLATANFSSVQASAGSATSSTTPPPPPASTSPPPVTTTPPPASTSPPPVTTTPPPTSTSPPPSPTPSPTTFTSTDIGAVGAVGTSSNNNGVYTIKGSGEDIWDTSDGFRYTYATLTGDGQITARVDSLDARDAWTKAGVMIRATLAANSGYAYAFVSGSSGVDFQWRTTSGGSAESGGNDGVTRVPYWVRLKRTGDVFTAYVSADGSTWRQLDSSVTISMARAVYVGLAVTSHQDGSLATANFSSVQSSDGSANSPTTPPPTSSTAAPTSGSAALTWTPPTRNTDGSTLTDLFAYKVYWGTSPGVYSNQLTLNNPLATTWTINNLGAGRWYFAVTSVTTGGIESAKSNEASKLIQ